MIEKVVPRAAEISKIREEGWDLKCREQSTEDEQMEVPIGWKLALSPHRDKGYVLKSLLLNDSPSHI